MRIPNKTRFVFEGVDRCGKSTFIEYLKTKVWSSYYAFKAITPSDKKQSQDYYLKSLKVISNKDSRATQFWDRFDLSEAVYSALYRPSEFNKDLLVYMRAKFLEMEKRYQLLKKGQRVIVVYMYPTNYSLLEKDERPNSNLDNELLLYDKLIYNELRPVIFLPVHDSDGNWYSRDKIFISFKEQFEKLWLN